MAVDDEHVVLRRCNSRHEAELLKSVLEAREIEASIVSDDCGSFDPALALVRGACVIVSEDDATRAEEVLSSPIEDADLTDWGQGPDEK
jgi:hypothetical protein